MRIRKSAVAVVLTVATLTFGLGATATGAGATSVKKKTVDWSHCLETGEISYDVMAFKVKWAEIELPSVRSCTLVKTRDVTVYNSQGAVVNHKVRTTNLGLYVDMPNAQGTVNQFQCDANPVAHIFDGDAHSLGVTTQRLQRTEWQVTSWCRFEGVISYEGVGTKLAIAMKVTQTFFGTSTIFAVTAVQGCNWDKTNCSPSTTIDLRSKTSDGWLTVQPDPAVQVPLFGPNGKPAIPPPYNR